MSGYALTTASQLHCPHGGKVQIVTTNTQTKAGGALIVTAADTFIVGGCPFHIPAAPSPIPSPCVTVRWIVPDTRARVNGNPTLSQSSVGLCLNAVQVPQGPVTVAQTQACAQSQ